MAEQPATLLLVVSGEGSSLSKEHQRQLRGLWRESSGSVHNKEFIAKGFSKFRMISLSLMACVPL